MQRSTARRLALAAISTRTRGRLGFPLTSRFISTLSDAKSDTSVPGAVEDAEHLTPWENKVVTTLRTYKEKHGDLLVPQSFVVSIDDESWPSIARGYRLGAAVSVLRRSLNRRTPRKLSTNLVKELDAMEFVRDPIQLKWGIMILPSLEVFSQKFGHCLVGRPFKVPEDPKWPKVAWGLKLGSVVNKLREGGCYAEQVAKDEDRLAQIGFAWNHKESMWNNHIVPSLEVYVHLFKHCRIPHKFVVPSKKPWPRAAWTLKLGFALDNIRHKGNYFAYYGRDIEKLDELGLNLKLSAQPWKNRVAPLLDIYSTASETKEIPDDFVIPSKAPWPEEMWGVRLGLIVARNSHHLPRALGKTDPGCY